MCPDDWMYTEISIDGTSNTIIASVCSKECALSIWKPGPGPRLTNEDFEKFKKEEEILNKAKEIVKIIEVTES